MCSGRVIGPLTFGAKNGCSFAFEAKISSGQSKLWCNRSASCREGLFYNFFSLYSLVKSKSSHEWLARQMRDPYVEKAKVMNYRCRSAFKLLEMNEKFHFLYPGQHIIECGAAPGSWTQVLVHETNANGKDHRNPIGKVVSVDRLPIYHVDGATVLGGMNFTTPDVQKVIMKYVGEKQVDAVVSDMAPNATGVKRLDQEAIMQLAYSVLRFAVKISKVDPKAVCLIKVWESELLKQLECDMKRFYKRVKIVKPPASRSDSSEQFLLGIGFNGLKGS